MRFSALLAPLALFACTHGAPSNDPRQIFTPMNASASLINSSGQSIGAATLTQGPKGVLIRIEIGAGGLTPGWHGLHFHSVGDCSDVSGFQKSGGHHGKVDGAHGLLNPAGPEAGDLPNLWASATGAAGFEGYTSAFGLADALDTDGLAFIVHASADDHVSQPIGGAGARVACGVVK